MTNDTNGCPDPRIPDELDLRIRSLEAERARPVPPAPPVRALHAAAQDLLHRLQRDYDRIHPDDEEAS